MNRRSFFAAGAGGVMAASVARDPRGAHPMWMLGRSSSGGAYAIDGHPGHPPPSLDRLDPLSAAERALLGARERELAEMERAMEGRMFNRDQLRSVSQAAHRAFRFRDWAALDAERGALMKLSDSLYGQYANAKPRR